MTRSGRSDRRQFSAPLAGALAAAVLAVGALLALTGHDDQSQPALTTPSTLSPSQAAIARGQAAAQRFAREFAGYLNGTRDVDDLARAGASPTVVRSIRQEPTRGDARRTRGHFAAQDVQVQPDGADLQLTATFVDGDLRVPLVATMRRHGATWQVDNFYAGHQD